MKPQSFPTLTERVYRITLTSWRNLMLQFLPGSRANTYTAAPALES